MPALPLRWTVLFRVAVAAGVIALLAMFGKPDLYRSEAVLLPRGGPHSIALATLGALGPLIDSHTDEGYYGDILESRWLREQLLEPSFTFRYRTWKFGAERSFTGGLTAFLDPRGELGRDEVLDLLDSWIIAQRDQQTGTIRVSVTTVSPELAYQLDQKVVLSLEKALKEKIISQGRARADYTRTRVELARDEEAAARGRFVAFCRDHVNYADSPDPGVRTQGEALFAELKLKREVLASMTLAQVQAEVEAHSTLPVVSVLEDGFVPSRKAGPPRVAIALAAALAAGLACWLLSQFLLLLRGNVRGQAR